MRTLWRTSLVIGTVALVCLVVWFGPLQHWAAIHTGTLNESGPYYGFWSGFGSDLGEVTLIAAILTPAVVTYRHHECHVGPCHRLAHHTTPKGFKLCKRCVAKPLSSLEHDLHDIHPDHA